MSFQKDFLKSKLANLPPLPPLEGGSAADEDQEEELEDGIVSDLGLPAPKPRPSRSRPPPAGFTAIPAVPTYFASSSVITPPATADAVFPSFKTYYTPPRPLSGEGLGTVLVFHHGGGEGALGFSLAAKEITEGSKGELGVLAFDCRGHGETADPDLSSAEATVDLSLATLTADFLALLRTMFPDPKTSPAFVLVGHSMGAAPVLESTPLLQKLGYKVPGVVILDVVEGSAIEALPLMRGIIASRPSSFRSVEEAIDWHLSSSTLSSPLAARLSVPSLVTPLPSPSTRVRWTTDLVATEPFWVGWYTSLSDKFLAVRAARMLVLAGTDRIDKPLMIAQMQGKFQHVVLPNVGHHLHQDAPDRLAELLVEFWTRNQPLDLRSIKKVGQV